MKKTMSFGHELGGIQISKVLYVIQQNGAEVDSYEIDSGRTLVNYTYDNPEVSIQLMQDLKVNHESIFNLLL